MNLDIIRQSEFDTAVAVRSLLGHEETEVGVVPALLDGTRVVVYTIPSPQNAEHEVPVAMVVANNKELFARLVPGETDVRLVADDETTPADEEGDREGD